MARRQDTEHKNYRWIHSHPQPKLFIYLFRLLLLAVSFQVFAAAWAFPSRGEWGTLSSCGVWVSHCRDFCCGAQALGCAGFSSCSSWALEHRLNSCGPWAWLLHNIWDRPRPGIKPVSLALAGRFFTSEPPGKPPIKKKKTNYWTQTKGGKVNKGVEDPKYTFLIFPSKTTERNLPSSHSRPHPRKH